MHDHTQHSHGAEYEAGDGRVDRALAIGVGLNAIYVVAEFGYGVAADSVALLADAAHNLGDVLGLLIAWGATWLARSQPAGRRTYGLQKSTVLAALANALLLIGVTGALVWEAVERIVDPPSPSALTMTVVAGIGVLVNAIAALVLLRSGRAHGHGHGHEHTHDPEHEPGGDINLRGAFLHMAADAGVSAGVVVTGAVLLYTDWHWLDPATSLIIAVVIFAGTWSLLREALNLALDAAPRHIDLDGIREFLAAWPGVIELHDLHVWALGTREVALTAHLVVEARRPSLIVEIEHELVERFGVAHTTLQVETPDERRCAQRC